MSQLAIAGRIAEFIKGRDFRMLIRGDLVGAANVRRRRLLTHQPASLCPRCTKAPPKTSVVQSRPRTAVIGRTRVAD